MSRMSILILVLLALAARPHHVRADSPVAYNISPARGYQPSVNVPVDGQTMEILSARNTSNATVATLHFALTILPDMAAVAVAPGPGVECGFGQVPGQFYVLCEAHNVPPNGLATANVRILRTSPPGALLTGWAQIDNTYPEFPATEH